MKSTSQVSSWAMESFTYDEKTKVLAIQMVFNPPKNHGETLLYGNVPRHLVREFEKAESKGAFFNIRIRPEYPYLGNK